MDRGVRSFRALLPPPPPRRGQWLLPAVPSLLSRSLRHSDCDDGGGGGGIRDAAAYATPSLSGGSGGDSRGILPRVSPVPSLDAQQRQRVQGDAHHRLTILDTEPLSTLAAEFQYSSPILQQELKEPLHALAAEFQYGSPILQEKIELLDRAEVERTQKNILETIIVLVQIKSFAELPVLLAEQFCKDNKCEDCARLLSIDLLLSNTDHFFSIVLNWLGGSESQDTLSQVLAGIKSPLDTGFFCKSVNSSTMYTVTSMICCADESYVCFAHDDEDKWLIYDFETVKTENTWEHLLERFKDRKLQPEFEFYYKHTICCADESYVCFARDDEDKWLIYDFETVKTEDTWEHLLERFKDRKLQAEFLFFEVIK